MIGAILTPFVARKEVRHGQGIFSYGASNEMHTELVGSAYAPDPIRQSDTPARAPRRQIAIMSTDPEAYGRAAGAENFLSNANGHILTRRLMPAGRVTHVRAQNTVGVRPNIARPPAVAYGSLFALSQPTYDVT